MESSLRGTNWNGNNLIRYNDNKLLVLSQRQQSLRILIAPLKSNYENLWVIVEQSVRQTFKHVPVLDVRILLNGMWIIKKEFNDKKDFIDKNQLSFIPQIT